MGTVRAARVSDAQHVWALLTGLVIGVAPERRTFDATFPELVSSERVAVLVYDDGGEVGGYVHALVRPSLYANGPVCWVSELMVASHARRRGAGTALVRAVEEWAGAQGCGEVTLATSRAQEFYEAIGYQATAQYFKKHLAGTLGT